MKLITLKTHAEFKQILSKGTKVVKTTFVFFHLTQNESRVGFIASRKHFRRAVDRNKAKRRLRAALHQLLNNSNTQSIILSSHCVFILRRAILNYDFRGIIRELEDASKP